MKTIPFDIKYRPEIESGKYKVETRDGLPVRIVCWDRVSEKSRAIIGLITNEFGNETIQCYLSDGRTDYRNDGNDIFIITDEPEEHPIITELKEHLASLSEDDKQKEWKELQKWYEDRFKHEQKDWVEEFRKYLEAMSQEEFEEKWNEVKKRCGEDSEEVNSEELTEFEYAVLSVISDHNTHTDSIEEFAKRNAKNLLTVAYKQFEKERLELPEDKLDSIDFFFDHWKLDNMNASKRECFRTGYACGRASIKSEIPKWNKHGWGISGNTNQTPTFLIRTGYGYYFLSNSLSDGSEYIVLSDLEKLPKQWQK